MNVVTRAVFSICCMLFLLMAAGYMMAYGGPWTRILIVWSLLVGAASQYFAQGEDQRAYRLAYTFIMFGAGLITIAALVFTITILAY